MDKTAWDKFVSGHWQREVPQREGLYPTADYNGDEAAMKVVFKHPDTGHYECAGSFKGWFWSEPWPGLPKAPTF